MPKSKPAKQVKQPCWLNRKEMAASIGISTQAFGNWGLQSVAKIGRETFYTVDDVIDYCVARELKKFGERDKVLSKEIDELLSKPDLPLNQRAEIMKLKKLEQECHRLALQNTVLEGRSLPAWGVTEVLSRILSRTGEVFDGLALKVKRKHPDIDKRVIELIKSESVKTLNEVARLDEYIEEIIEDVVAEAEERVR